MIEQELTRIWQSSSNEELVKFEKSRLMIETESSLDRIHKVIKYRDISETIGAVIVVPVFIYYAFTIPPVLTKLASVLIAIWAVFVVVHLRRARIQQPKIHNVSYLEYLTQTKQYLLVQKRLLDTVLYWYILPFTIFIMIFLIGMLDVSGNITRIAFTAAFGLSLGVAIYFLNKRAVKKQIMPRLMKVEKLIELIGE